ncbi:beta strand repeat-containing protein, partial [Flavobacterium sp.]|uniref:beta strand repeat-containing protein n=1 Tax=Flavobacterium sp. TaxID=239 RepID=UPI0038D3AE1E
MKSNFTLSKNLCAFLILNILCISMSFAQTFPPTNTSCTSKDLEVVAATLSGGGVCNSCPTPTTITRNLMLGINNTTGSTRTSFAFWGTLEIYSGTTGALISSVNRTGCNGPLPGGSTTYLDFGTITYTCGDIIKISNIWEAWTTSNNNETCPLDPNNISPKCGKIPSITVNGGVNGEFASLDSQCGSATGSLDLTPTGGLAPYTYLWTASGGGVVPSGQSTNQDLTGLVPGTYSLKITDANGCIINKSRTVVATVAPLPVFSSANTIAVPCGGATTSTLTYTNNASGACLISGSVTSTLSAQTPTGACGGTVVETWTYTDAHGRTITQTRNITVSPAALPKMTAPANITVACGSIPTSSTIPFSNGLSSGCLVSGTSNTSTFTATPGACGGTVTETWTATDSCGRALAPVSRTITVSPAALPTMTAPANITVACGALPVASTISFSNGLSSGCLVSGTSNTSTFTATPGACGGTVTETWTATDSCGRALAPVSRTITVSPAALPTMTAPIDTTVACGSLPAASTISFSNGLTGGCLISGTSNPSTFSATPSACGGNVIETWTATDSCGRALASVSRTITVSPAALPTMTALANTTVTCGGLPQPSTIPFSNNLSGGCLIAGTSNLSTFTTTVSGYCNGSVTETWTATDSCGRELNSVSRTITINDTIPPTFTTPGNITSNTDANCSVNLNPSTTGNPTNVSDNCDANPTVTYVDSECFGNFTEGNVNAGNGNYFYFDVSGFNNATAANIKKVALAFETNQGKGRAEFTLVSPSGQAVILVGPYCTGGNCDDANSSSQELYLPEFYPTGSGYTQWNNNNPITTGVAQNFTPNGSLSSPNTINGLTSYVSGFENLTGPMNGTWFIYSRKQSNVNGSINFKSVCLTPTSLCPNNRVITRTWTVTDACGNSTTGAQTITIQDITAPTWSTATGSLDTTVECSDAAALAAAQALAPVATDNCAGNITYIKTPGAFVASQGCANAGTYTNTWTAKDVCNNISIVFTQVITVQDTMAPIWETAIGTLNVTVECADKAALTAAQELIPVASDLCDADVTNIIKKEGNFIPAIGCDNTGTYTNEWTVIDACGNDSVAFTQIITIVDTTAPTIDTAAANAIVQCDGNGNTAALQAWLNSNGGAIASDTCSNVVWSNNYTSLTDGCGNTGTTTVTFTATDGCSNATTTSATFTIEDTTAPTIDTVAANATVECDGQGNTPALQAWLSSNGGALASDACSNVTWTNSFDALSDGCGNSGTATVTFTATDDCGNATTTSATFTIEDTTAPTIDTAATNLVVQCDGGGNTAVLQQWIANNGGASASDICSNVTWSNDFNALANDCSAAVTVTFTATDDCGNATSTSATFTVQDIIAPTIDIVAANATVECDGNGNPEALTAWLASNGGASASDVCSNITWTNSFTELSDGCGNTGTATVTFTATDDCGNATTTSANFTIEDTTAPTIDTAAANATVECDGQGNTAALQAWLSLNGGASASDVCSNVTWTNSFTELSDGCGNTGTA